MTLIQTFRHDERGSISVLMAILMVPLIGCIALGCEASFWMLKTRQMQNAADAAALAAAINGGDNYADEARALAAANGFVDGANNSSVTPSNTAACPDGTGNNCYSVKVAGSVPLLFSQVVFSGDGHGAKQLSASAVAASTGKSQVCLLALGTGIVGTLSGNLNECNTMSDSSAQCDGALGIAISFAAGSNIGCGANREPSPILADPYVSLASNIAPTACGPNPASQLSGTLSLSAGSNFRCGDQHLTGDVVISTPIGQSAALIIQDGGLDLNGFTLRTSFGSGVTLVFSGSGVRHAVIDSKGIGALDIAAPTIAPWAGVALYQDPALTTGVDMSIPTGWNVSGLIYAPHAALTLTGAIDHATNGKACVVMVADHFQISGNGGISGTDIGQCDLAKLKPPVVTHGRAALVQ